MMEFYRVKIIFPTTVKMLEDEPDDSELSEVDRIRMKNNGLEYGYDTDWGYWNLILDPITQISPRSILKKGNTNKTYFTEVVFQSGHIAYTPVKADDLVASVKKYMEEAEDENQE